MSGTVFSKSSTRDGEVVGVTVGTEIAEYKKTRVVLLEKGTDYKQVNSANVLRVLSEERHHWGDIKRAQNRAVGVIESFEKGTSKQQEERGR